MQKIFNYSHLAINKARSCKNFKQHNFIHQLASDHIKEFIVSNNRIFKNILIWGNKNHIEIKNAIYADIISEGADIVANLEYNPFKSSSFDLIIIFMNFHNVNDPVGALIQMRKSLKKNGVILAITFGGTSLIELRKSLMQAEMELNNCVTNRVFPFADVKDYGMLLQRVGFAMPVASSNIYKVSYDNVMGLMHDLRGMGENNYMTNRYFLSRNILAKTSEIYQSQYSDRNGGIIASFELIDFVAIN
jgi:SAM-dependent methyltransferase